MHKRTSAFHLLLRATLVAALLQLLSIQAFADDLLDKHIVIDIPPNTSLEDALIDWGEKAGMTIMIDTASVADKVSPGIHGSMTARDALVAILVGSGLSYAKDRDRVQIVRGNSYVKSSLRIEDSASGEGQSPGVLGTTAGDSSSDSHAKKNDIDEVLVTAQKRSERLQDVPVPVTALNANTLVDQDQVRLEDYFQTVPGLNFTMGNRGEPSLSIRGISTGLYNNPTVAVTIDDVQYGSSTSIGGGYAVPDIDPNDLARVEVLRGPQGTLYGASSLGGLVKYVTVDPTVDKWTGDIQAGTSETHGATDLGYNVSGAVNVPVADTIAVRMSGFARRDPGYVDNIETGQNGINSADVYGGRIATLWKPADDWSLRLSALYQKNDRNGSPDVFVEPGYGDLQQGALISTGRYDKEIQAYSANLSGEFQGINLVALTGYSRNRAFASTDYTSLFSSTSEKDYGVTGSPIDEIDRTLKVSQEVRLSSSIGEHFDWLAGGFYTHERSSVNSGLISVDPTTGAVAGSLFFNFYPTSYTEYAVFTDLTVHFTDQFNIQFGGRESRDEQTYTQTVGGPLFGNVTSVIPEVDTKGNAFTYLVTPQYKLSADSMLYARFASGYRPGGPNGACTLFNFPCQFAPDKTNDYELGMKTEVFNRKLSLDVSLYYVDWKNIQLTVEQLSSGESYGTNGSRAKSEGLEFSAQARPVTGLTLATWVAWDNAALTEPFPPTSASTATTIYGVAGNRLPYSSRFSGDFSVEQRFPLIKALEGFVGGEAQYVGDREGVFTGSATRQDFPGYAQVNLRGGARFDSWTLNLFVNNVGDRRGVLDGGLGTFPAYAFNYIQPRTAGLSMTKVF